MKRDSISKTSFRILENLNENGKSSLTVVAEDLDLSYPAVSRHLRGDNKYGFLDALIVTEANEDDQRYKNIFIDTDKQDEVDTLLEAFRIVEKYGRGAEEVEEPEEPEEAEEIEEAA